MSLIRSLRTASSVGITKLERPRTVVNTATRQKYITFQPMLLNCYCRFPVERERERERECTKISLSLESGAYNGHYKEEEEEEVTEKKKKLLRRRRRRRSY